MSETINHKAITSRNAIKAMNCLESIMGKMMCETEMTARWERIIWESINGSVPNLRIARKYLELIRQYIDELSGDGMEMAQYKKEI